MRCPYDDKIDACVYLEEMEEGNRKYECPDCPHYKPRRYLQSADKYYNNPNRESFVILVFGVCFLTLLIMLLLYLGLKLFDLVMI